MRKRRRSWKTMLIFFLVVTVVFWSFLDWSMRPLTQEYAVNRAKNLAGEAMVDAVNRVLCSSEEYSDFTTVKRDADGAVLSVEANPAAVNRLRADVIATLGEVMSQDDISTLKVPILNATGSAFLMGRGPKIAMKIQQNGAATADITSTFSAAGINQTIHRLDVTVTFRATVMVAGISEAIETKNTFLIAETVIVGTVPELYADITKG